MRSFGNELPIKRLVFARSPLGVLAKSLVFLCYPRGGDRRRRVRCGNNWILVCRATSFRSDVSAFFGDGAFHEENENDQCDGDYGEEKECVEVGEGRGLLFAQVGETL